ncbi:uncharacterized protein PSFLO_07779 [Pseudozyma flocculosa]|uniref:Uncharacterized protein n=1 Tax=Pseudozyma flocculosa TaxID=84751 RepID=A0A5C3FDV9_9BASI|nr:uncharacterized protein PSFLO_07779 [Pseudozyma flocculosa]
MAPKQASRASACLSRGRNSSRSPSPSPAPKRSKAKVATAPPPTKLLLPTSPIDEDDDAVVCVGSQMPSRAPAVAPAAAAAPAAAPAPAPAAATHAVSARLEEQGKQPSTWSPLTNDEVEEQPLTKYKMLHHIMHDCHKTLNFAIGLAKSVQERKEAGDKQMDAIVNLAAQVDRVLEELADARVQLANLARGKGVFTSSDNVNHALFKAIDKKRISEPFADRPLRINWNAYEYKSKFEVGLTDWAANKIANNRGDYGVPEDMSLERIKNGCLRSLRNHRNRGCQMADPTKAAKERERVQWERRYRRRVVLAANRMDALKSLMDYEGKKDPATMPWTSSCSALSWMVSGTWKDKDDEHKAACKDVQRNRPTEGRTGNQWGEDSGMVVKKWEEPQQQQQRQHNGGAAAAAIAATQQRRNGRSESDSNNTTAAQQPQPQPRQRNGERQ